MSLMKVVEYSTSKAKMERTGDRHACILHCWGKCASTRRAHLGWGRVPPPPCVPQLVHCPYCACDYHCNPSHVCAVTCLLGVLPDTDLRPSQCEGCHACVVDSGELGSLPHPIDPMPPVTVPTANLLEVVVKIPHLLFLTHPLTPLPSDLP